MCNGNKAGYNHLAIQRMYVLPHFSLLSGANLKMYHGTMIDHLSHNAGTIYFVCNQGYKGRAEAPTFEHVKAAINQAHFKFFTHLAC